MSPLTSTLCPLPCVSRQTLLLIVAVVTNRSLRLSMAYDEAKAYFMWCNLVNYKLFSLLKAPAIMSRGYP
jgi:hypothetical protein